MSHQMEHAPNAVPGRGEGDAPIPGAASLREPLPRLGIHLNRFHLRVHGGTIDEELCTRPIAPPQLQRSYGKTL